MISYEAFLENVRRVEAQMLKACESAGRAVDSVKLLPITKKWGGEAVDYAQKAGLHSVGESRVQEAVEKKAACGVRTEWELVGHLQSNKAALAVETFDRIQSVDSTKLLGRLSHAGKVLHKEVRVLLQVNTSNDPMKFGVEDHHAEGLLECALELGNIRVEGLMTIGEHTENELMVRETFERLRKLRDTLEGKMGVALPELSMGMTEDLEIAIEEGSTMIRVGRGLYGERS